MRRLRRAAGRGSAAAIEMRVAVNGLAGVVDVLRAERHQTHDQLFARSCDWCARNWATREPQSCRRRSWRSTLSENLSSVAAFGAVTHGAVRGAA